MPKKIQPFSKLIREATLLALEYHLPINPMEFILTQKRQWLCVGENLIHTSDVFLLPGLSYEDYKGQRGFIK